MRACPRCKPPQAHTLLGRYSLVIIDEAHERTVHTDVLLGLLRRVLDARPEGFRLIVMSATLDADAFADFFRDARAVYVQGRQFPVQVRSLRSTSSRISAHAPHGR